MYTLFIFVIHKTSRDAFDMHNITTAMFIVKNDQNNIPIDGTAALKMFVYIISNSTM